MNVIISFFYNDPKMYFVRTQNLTSVETQNFASLHPPRLADLPLYRRLIETDLAV